MSVTSGTKSESGFGETIRVIIHALLIALVIRTFLFQPFNIPSGSMKATVVVGDYLFVSTMAYGYSRPPFPWVIIPFTVRIFRHQPKRAAAAVSKLPRDTATDSINRVPGLPSH